MPYIIISLKAILGYFFLMFISTNLIGVVLRGLIKPKTNPEQLHFVMKEDISSDRSVAVTVIFITLSILYLFFLYAWNIGVGVVGTILMITRIPDAIFEIKTGQKINLKNMRKKPMDVILNIFSWLSLPLLWYSLYTIRFPQY